MEQNREYGLNKDMNSTRQFSRVFKGRGIKLILIFLVYLDISNLKSWPCGIDCIFCLLSQQKKVWKIWCSKVKDTSQANKKFPKVNKLPETLENFLKRKLTVDKNTHIQSISCHKSRLPKSKPSINQLIMINFHHHTFFFIYSTTTKNRLNCVTVYFYLFLIDAMINYLRSLILYIFVSNGKAVK